MNNFDVVDFGILIISFTALFISLSSIKQAKGNNEINVMTLWFQKNSDMAKMKLEWIHLSEEEKAADNDFWKKKYRSCYIDYYNLLEYMCIKYLNNEISKKTFRDVMCDEIKDLCAENHAKKYKVDINDWPNIIKVCEDIKYRELEAQKTEERIKQIKLEEEKRKEERRKKWEE